MPPFEHLSQRAQIGRLRPTAHEALRAYGLQDARLRLLNHGFNTIFRVDTAAGERYALRLNVNSRRSPAQIAAEMAWLDALSRDTPLQLPTPLLSRDGQRLQHIWNEALGRELPAAVFSWLPGRVLGARATPAQLREVGRVTATLHQHAHTWALPDGAELHSLQDPLMGTPSHLDEDHGHLTPEGRKVVVEVLRRVNAELGKLYAHEVPRPLHADLHLWNLHWHAGRLSVFDFDDCALGLPVQDLAISAYYLRPKPELEAALLEGYAAVAPLPSFTPATYETLVAGRGVVLLNDVLGNTTASIRAVLPRYVPNAITKLRHFLDYGEFRHDLPGLLQG
ncbi:phosphotransferase enzyme family protein [Deinococcus navajonensis]|uniref:Phosphotransferase enzyme family protein n=1 Tax=Deinococcus navajonensis TaxID=309884 RepID=A0ABV8XMG1_9DEIO